MDETYYDLSIEKTTYDLNKRRLYLRYQAAVNNGMNPEDNKVHGKTKEVMFERRPGYQYLYESPDINILLEIVKP